MTEIDIERKPPRRPWGWILAGILVVILAVAAFAFYTDAGREMMGEDEPEMEMEMEPGMQGPSGTERPPAEGGPRR